MRKLRVSLIAIVMFLFCSVGFASAQTMMLEYDGGTHEYKGEIYALVVNNQLINPPLSPIIFNDRALVPVREIFEEVGATVNYINDTQTIEVSSDEYDVVMRINDNVAYINGEKTNIPDNVVPKLISKVGGETKTMVPVRFISETIGLDVKFDSEDGAILIDSDGYVISDENQEPSIDDVVPQPDNSDDSASYTPSVETKITNVSYDITGDNSIKVTVTSNADISSYSDFTLSSPERVVVDFAGMKFDGVGDTLSVNKAGVTSVRMGDNDERARVVVDISNLKKYNIEKTANNSLTDKISELAALDEPILRQCILLLYRKTGAADTPENVHITAVASLVRESAENGKNAEICLPGGLSAHLSDGHLFFSLTVRRKKPENKPYFYPVDEGFFPIPDTPFAVECTDVRALLHKDCMTQRTGFTLYDSAILDKTCLCGSLCVRSRKEGDTVKCGGMTRKLKELFTKKKIPAQLRGILPIVCTADGCEILFVPRTALSDAHSRALCTSADLCRISIYMKQ